MKKNFKKIVSLLLVTLMLVNCVSCTPGSKNTSTAYQYKSSSFEEFTNDLFVNEVTNDSITLNYTLAHPENFGITEVVPSYGFMDIEKVDDDSQTIEALKTLKKFKYESLTEDEQLTYDILKDYLETYLEYSDMYLYDKTLSPTIGLNCQLPVILAEYSFRTNDDVYDYVELLEQTDKYFDFLLQLEQLKSEKGLFMMDEIADMIIEQCNNFAENPNDNYLIEIFNDKIDGMDFPENEKNTLKTRNMSAVLEHVIPAYTNLAKGLEELKGSGRYDGGLCNYPDGEKYYEYLVLQGTGSKRSIKEIETLLDDYMVKAYTQMGTALRESPDIFELVQNASFGLDDPYEILTDLQKRISKEFPKAPDTNYTIKYVHESLEDNLSPAFYMTPAIDDYKENVIYINNSDNYEGQEIYTTLAHEGFPGHLYQTVYTNSKGISPVRSIINYPGYTEGWATYVELLSYNMGAMEPLYGSFLSANQLIVLALYAKCDIGVNVHGWEIDDVSKYVASIFGEMDREIIEEIYYSMVSEPANYLKYVVGCLEFMELRNTAEQALGNKFDPVAYHDFILTIGPAPFYIISDRLNTWISKQ
ncbi:MAG: DUF885 domain-containing protein [Lachnospiraceae bacterium]